MNTIAKLALALAFSSVFCVALSNAQEAPKAATPTYADIQRTCGMEWRESDKRKTVAKGEGSVAWNEFRKECVARKGYVSKRDQKAPEGFVRVPDKAN